MNQIKLNTHLYQKMLAEQKLCQAGLLLMPPTEILKHAYEYVCRENILLSLGYKCLYSRQALALMNSPLYWQMFSGSLKTQEVVFRWTTSGIPYMLVPMKLYGQNTLNFRAMRGDALWHISPPRQ